MGHEGGLNREVVPFRGEPGEHYTSLQGGCIQWDKIHTFYCHQHTVTIISTLPTTLKSGTLIEVLMPVCLAVEYNRFSTLRLRLYRESQIPVTPCQGGIRGLCIVLILAPFIERLTGRSLIEIPSHVVCCHKSCDLNPWRAYGASTLAEDVNKRL